MSKKFLTLDDLLLFCKENNFSHFNASEAGGPIVVHTQGTFEASNESNSGLMPVKLQACHINKNVNGSSISAEVMTKALPSIYNKPILANIHQLDDGTWDFKSHDMEIVADEDGDVRVDYIEQPIGVIPESGNARLEYDEDKDNTYVVVNGYLFDEYSRACEIMRTKGVTKVSVELCVNDLSYNAKDECLSINDFYFMGITALGKEKDGTVIEEGMKGSNMTITDFSANNNSITIDVDAKFSDQLIEMLERIEKACNDLSNFNNKNDTKEKGGADMNKFEELLAAYGLVAEDIDFEVEGVSDEDLEASFVEKFGTVEEYKASQEEETPEVEEDKFQLIYELSHDDVRNGLYGLLNSTVGENAYAWICEVFDDHFIYNKETYNETGYDSQYFKQSYSVDGDDVSFGAEPVEVFPTFVTADEKSALEMLRTQYEELKAFKEGIEAKEQQSEKNAIFEREEFSVLAENEDFVSLKDNVDNFTVEEVEFKAKQIFADHVISSGQFAMGKNDGEKKTKKIGFNFDEKPVKTEAYAGLFKD